MSSTRVLIGRKTIIAEIPIKGLYKLDGGLVVRNKFTRNMGFIIDGLLRQTNVNVFDEGGTSRSIATGDGGLIRSWLGAVEQGPPMFVQFGTGTTPPVVTNNNLASPSIHLPTSYIDVVEGANNTNILIASRYSPSSLVNITEVGLKLLTDAANNLATLLSRAVLPSAVSRSSYSIYFDGYELNFPAEFTRWFVRALYCSMAGHRRRPTVCLPAKMADGSDYSIQNGATFAGSPDVVIGSDNTPSSPTDLNLRSPIASLSGQAQTVEVDTALNEIRIVRTGIYTPTTTTQLGEIGLFVNINGIIGVIVAPRRTLIARVALPTLITLSAGTTYTLGIVLRFS
jgi:hypothetical protein